MVNKPKNTNVAVPSNPHIYATPHKHADTQYTTTEMHNFELFSSSFFLSFLFFLHYCFLCFLLCFFLLTICLLFSFHFVLFFLPVRFTIKYLGKQLNYRKSFVFSLFFYVRGVLKIATRNTNNNYTMEIKTLSN